MWCQLFSEPGAGSDVAGLATKAVRDGEEWIVNGQKVWTTLAHLSKWGMLVARTDAEAPKHKGMTYFVVDMQGPGVEVRPLYQITGEAEFNEVYFTDARIPDSERLSEPGRRLAGRAHHPHERAGGHRRRDPREGLRVHRRGREGVEGAGPRRPRPQGRADGAVDPRRGAAAHQHPRRPAARRSATPGPRARSARRCRPTSTRTSPRSRSACMGAEGMLKPDGYPMKRPEHAMTWGSPQQAFLRTRANSIEGGTTEIAKNILGERVLGLPGRRARRQGRPLVAGAPILK